MRPEHTVNAAWSRSALATSFWALKRVGQLFLTAGQEGVHRRFKWAGYFCNTVRRAVRLRAFSAGVPMEMRIQAGKP